MIIESIKKLGFVLITNEVINGQIRVDFEVQINKKVFSFFIKRILLIYIENDSRIFIQKETNGGYDTIFNGLVDSAEDLNKVAKMCLKDYFL